MSRDIQGAVAVASEPALVASLPEPVPVSAHAGDGQAQRLPAPGKAPCGSCPYRRDVPAGVWHPSEYAKLPGYDGETFRQTALGLFFCHQKDGNLCAGWVGCHDAREWIKPNARPIERPKPVLTPIRQLNDALWPPCDRCGLGVSKCECAEYQPRGERS